MSKTIEEWREYVGSLRVGSVQQGYVVHPKVKSILDDWAKDRESLAHRVRELDRALDDSLAVCDKVTDVKMDIVRKVVTQEFIKAVASKSVLGGALKLSSHYEEALKVIANADGGEAGVRARKALDSAKDLKVETKMDSLGTENCPKTE